MEAMDLPLQLLFQMDLKVVVLLNNNSGHVYLSN